MRKTIGALKLSMLQEQIRRDEERRLCLMDREDDSKRREDASRLREEEMVEERERREDDRYRSDRKVQLIMHSVMGKHGVDAAKDLMEGEQ